MKRLGILLPILLLSITWQTGTNAVAEARGASLTTEFVSHNALAQSVSGAWVIATFSDAGFHTSIVVDSNDLVHISYSDGSHLKYMRQYLVGDDIWWAIYTITTADVGGTSLTLDENDRPYIAYYDETAQNLCWAWSPTDGTWNTGTRNTAGVIDGEHPSAVMRGGTLHVAYLNLTTSDVEYIQITPGGGWPPTPQIAGGSASPYADISLALRSDGLPRISYGTQNGELVYVRYTGSAWTQEVLDGNAEHEMGECNSLALNAGNDPRIAYFDATNEDLRYRLYGLIGWSNATIVDDGLEAICYVSLALDEEDHSRILYYSGYTDGSLRYARQSGSAWSFETVDGPDSSCGMHSALALDSLGRPHASYFCSGKLTYAYRGAFQVFLPAVMRGQ